MREQASMSKSEEPLPLDPIFQAVKRLAEVMLPDSISWDDVKDHIPKYDKAKAVHEVVLRARRDPIFTKMKLYIVYTELKQLADNGGLL